MASGGVGEHGTRAVVGGNQRETLAVGSGEEVAMGEGGGGGVDDGPAQQGLGDTTGRRHVDRLGGRQAADKQQECYDGFFHLTTTILRAGSPFIFKR